MRIVAIIVIALCALLALRIVFWAIGVVVTIAKLLIPLAVIGLIAYAVWVAVRPKKPA